VSGGAAVTNAQLKIFPALGLIWLGHDENTATGPGERRFAKMTKAGSRSALGLLLLMAAQAVLGRVQPDLYRDPAWIEATWIGNDWITLTIAVPLLAVGLLRSSSFEGARPVVLGVAAYGVYNYAFYLFGARLNAFFPLYVSAIWFAAACLIVDLRSSLVASPANMSQHRLIGAYLVFVALVLGAVWLVFWGGYALAAKPTPIEPEAFKVVAATDLVLLVPPLVTGGWMLWQGAAAGHLIAAIAAIQGALYLFVLTVNSAVAISMGLSAAPGELPIWGPLALLTALAALRLVLSFRAERN
jgi:hypothetical protein